jgi:hypothetical protein
MTENNTPLTAQDVTGEMLDAHRAQLENNVTKASTAYYSKPAGDDANERVALTEAQMQFNIWAGSSLDDQRTAVAKTVNDDMAGAEAEIPAEATKNTTTENIDPLIQRLRDEVAQKSSDAETWRERYNSAMRDQIHGDDPRLTDFWELAQQRADQANFCEQYDILAEALGGPSREKEYTVHHAITVSVTVSGYTAQTAGNNPDSSDFCEWGDYNHASDLASEIREAVSAGNFTIEEEEIQDWEEN